MEAKPIYIGDVVTKMSRPDTRFEVIQLAQAEQGQVFLAAYCSAEDNMRPGETFTVARGRLVDAYYIDQHSAACAVRELMHYVACHEEDEKLLFNGEPVFNPHDTWQASVRP